MMSLKAASIDECPRIEHLWHHDNLGDNLGDNLADNITVSNNLQISHSDIGPYIHAVCPTGYHVVGPSMVTCLLDGTWDDVTVPYCSSSSLYGIPQSDLVLIGVLAGCGAVVILALTIILAHLLCFRHKNIHTALSTDRLDSGTDSIPSTSIYVDDKNYCSISSPSLPTMNGKPMVTVHRNHHSNHHTINHAHHLDDSQSYGSSAYDEHDVNRLVSQLQHYPTNSMHNLYSGNQHDYPGHLSHSDRYDASNTDTHVQSQTGTGSRQHVSTIANGSVFINHAFSDELLRDYASRWENELNTMQAHPDDIHTLPDYPTDDRTMF